MYIHQRCEWPGLRWRVGKLAEGLAGGRCQLGRLLERMESLGFARRQDAMLDTLAADVVKSSEIEGGC